MVGTAIEFYDFYAYGTAAANYFPKVFFGDTTNPTVALLASLLTFAIAFIARPLGSSAFEPLRRPYPGRKTTLVVSLLTMGIAHLPDRLPADLQPMGCRGRRRAAPMPLRAGHRPWRRMVRRRVGGHRQRTLRKTSARCTAPSRKPGAPIGFFLSNGTYFLLETFNDNDAMLAWGWRVPFLLSVHPRRPSASSSASRWRRPRSSVWPRRAEEGRQVPAYRSVQEELEGSHPGATFLVAVTYTLFYTLHAGNLVPSRQRQDRR